MGLDVAAIDLGGFGDPPLFGQRRKNACPDTATAPPVPAIVNGGRRAILGRAISPASATLEHVDDPRNHPAIINSTCSGLVLWKVRLNGRPGFITQPEQSAHQRLQLHPRPENLICSIYSIC